MIEDMLFGTIVISQAKQIMLYNQVLYYRRIRNDSISSITNKQQALPFFINDISKKLSLEESRFYFYYYSNVCLCAGLYDYFFKQNKNKMDKKILEYIDLIISKRIPISLNALHFENDPRNARKQLKELKKYFKYASWSSIIAYFFPTIFRILRKIKQLWRG